MAPEINLGFADTIPTTTLGISTDVSAQTGDILQREER